MATWSQTCVQILVTFFSLHFTRVTNYVKANLNTGINTSFQIDLCSLCYSLDLSPRNFWLEMYSYICKVFLFSFITEVMSISMYLEVCISGKEKNTLLTNNNFSMNICIYILNTETDWMLLQSTESWQVMRKFPPYICMIK